MDELRMDRRRIRKLYRQGNWKETLTFKAFLRRHMNLEGYTFASDFRQYMQRKGMRTES